MEAACTCAGTVMMPGSYWERVRRVCRLARYWVDDLPGAPFYMTTPSFRTLRGTAYIEAPLLYVTWILHSAWLPDNTALPTSYAHATLLADLMRNTHPDALHECATEVCLSQRR